MANQDQLWSRSSIEAERVPFPKATRGFLPQDSLPDGRTRWPCNAVDPTAIACWQTHPGGDSPVLSMPRLACDLQARECAEQVDASA